jgi:glycosyltransferase involved in cell wall biosynthesis
MIYLSPMVYKVPGVDTRWEWFERNFNPVSYNLPPKYQPEDILLRYSTKGAINAKPGRSIALCWELLPELKRVFNTNRWDGYINETYAAARSCGRILISTEFSRADYEKYGKVDLLPIGVDTELFKPYSEYEQYELKLKYNVPLDNEIGFWCGSTEPMKGPNILQQYANEHPNIYWMIVWYGSNGFFNINGQQRFSVSQTKLVEFMNCADFHLSTSMLRPYYMVEYESMACNLKHRSVLGLKRDFEIGDNPRETIFEHKWDRITCKKLYEEYLNNL